MYAIIEEGGRQHKVTSGDRLRIDREVSPEEKTVTFDRVLLVGGGDGGAKIGTAASGGVVEGATVTAQVLGPVKGPKVDIVKHKRRKGYTKKIGHRQQYVEVQIKEITV